MEDEFGVQESPTPRFLVIDSEIKIVPPSIDLMLINVGEDNALVINRFGEELTIGSGESLSISRTGLIDSLKIDATNTSVKAIYFK